MARRASVLEQVRVAVESVAGTAVTADKRLMLTELIRPTHEAQIRMLLGVGNKYNVAQTVGKEHSVWGIGGEAGYNDLAYLLRSHLIDPGGSASYTFLPTISTGDAAATLSVEAGSAVRAEKAAYGFVSRLQIAASLAEVGISGTLIARRLSEGISFTSGSPTIIAPVPISPDEWEVYAGTTEGGIAKLNGIKECRVDFGEKWVPGFYADTAQPSFSDRVEKAPGSFLEVVGEYDAELSAFIAYMRSGATHFFQWRATGPVIGAGPGTYSLKVTAPCKLMAPTRDSGDEVERGTFRVEPVYDSAFASGTSALKVELVCTV